MNRRTENVPTEPSNAQPGHLRLLLLLGAASIWSGCIELSEPTDSDVSGYCFDCHGAIENHNSAPPPTSWSPEAAGDAHQQHLGSSAWHSEIPCDGCHLVPDEVLDDGHLDTELPAEIVWGYQATADDATPTFDETAASCDGVYCHGATLIPGGTQNTPEWMAVGTGQADCGSCHELPPSEPHPVHNECQTCHSVVLGSEGDFIAPGLHVDGRVQLDGTDCNSCHGSDGDPLDPLNWAPPTDTFGNTEVSARGVGAHQAHLANSDWRATVGCEACHQEVTDIYEAGHFDTALPAELTWGSMATHDGETQPELDDETLSCSGVYCHGATLHDADEEPSPTPPWTELIDGSLQCHSCHDYPPAEGHPERTDCVTCHAPVVGTDGQIAMSERHIDGNVDLGDLTCTTCHGSAGNPAPPTDTWGNEETTAPGVGAHSAHLQSSIWRGEIACEQCHHVPTEISEALHIDTPLPAEVTFGELATREGELVSEYDRDVGTCSDVYCHGVGLNHSGASNTVPTWTSVGEGEASCGTCHGLPPGDSHPQRSDCETCHDDVIRETMAFVDPSRHIDGVVNISALACDSCHGAEGEAAPPNDTRGNSEYSARGVGAHRPHFEGSDWHAPIGCEQCHPVPPSVYSSGHLDNSVPADIAWGDVASDGDSTSPIYDVEELSCGDVYCHGAGNTFGESGSDPIWTAEPIESADCQMCHGNPPPPRHPQRSDCATCHGQVVDEEGVFIAPELHINRQVELDADTPCDACHGSNGESAPPVDLLGNESTTARGVGAHRSHLGESAWHAEFECDDCHDVPENIFASGHIDDAPAELVFSDMATNDGETEPLFVEDDLTCAGVYCHGATLTLPGASSTTPDWVSVDLGEADCGTCHGNPPEGIHPPRTDCQSCHSQVMSGPAEFAFPALHVDGELQLDTMTCTSCHGSGSNPAPPVDLFGNSATSEMGVGAHRSHLGSSDWHVEVECDDCHWVPETIDDYGHIDGHHQAELDWSSRATESGETTPSFDRATGRCSDIYCHGATLTGAYGPSTSPRWNAFGSTSVPCDTCHVYTDEINCSQCHYDVVNDSGEIITEGLHIDGTVQADAGTCHPCHEPYE